MTGQELRELMMTLTLPDGRRLFKNQRDLADELVIDSNSGLSSDVGTMQGRLSAIFGGDSLSDELRAAILRATIRRLHHVELSPKMRRDIESRVNSGLTEFRQSSKQAGNVNSLKVMPTDHVWFFQSGESGLETVCKYVAETLAGFRFEVVGSITVVTSSVFDGVKVWEELGKALRETADEGTMASEFLATTKAIRVIAECFSHPTAAVVINPKSLNPDVYFFGVEGVLRVQSAATSWARVCRRVDAMRDLEPNANAWLHHQPVEPGSKVEITFRDAKPWLSDLT